VEHLLLSGSYAETIGRHLGRMKLTSLRVLGMSLLTVVSAEANQFNIGDTLSVAEASINPNLVINVKITSPSLNYSGGVYAGINQLTINGSQTVNGFCTDPFHYSSSSALTYTVVDLANAPKGDPFGSGMGSADALTIEKLWGAHYSAGMSATDAATLQLAIWDIVGSTDFSTTSTLNTTANSWISTVNAAGYNGPVADLVGLTGPGQDYVVQNVPDGGVSVALLGMTFLGLAAVRRKVLA